MRFYWNLFIELHPKKSEGVSSDKVLDSPSNLPGTMYMLVNMFALSFVLVHEDKMCVFSLKRVSIHVTSMCGILSPLKSSTPLCVDLVKTTTITTDIKKK